MLGLKPLRLSNWSGGLNRSLSDFEIRDDELWTAENCFLDSAAIIKRKGYSKLNADPLIADTEVLSVFVYGSYILANCGTKIFAITTAGVAVSIVTGLTAGYPVSYAVYDGTVYMSNGKDTPWKWDGVRAATTVDADSNAGQPVLNVASTTGFEVGKTVVINEGGPREETKIIAVGGITPGVSLTMTQNLTYAHTQLQADEVWSATTELSGSLPKAKWLVLHRDKLFYIATIDNPNYVYFSQAGVPETIDADAFFIVYTDDNQELTGGASLYGYLMLFKESSTHKLGGTTKQQLTLASNLVSAHPRIGCIAFLTITHVPGGLMFLSNDGVQFTNTVDIVRQSDNVDYFLSKMADAHKEWCSAFWDGKNLRVSYPTGSNTYPNESLVYGEDGIKNALGPKEAHKPWALWTYGMNAYSRALNGIIYAASGAGQVYIIDSGLSDDEADIQLKAATKVFDSGTPYLTKIYRYMGMNVYRSACSPEFIMVVDRGLASYLKALDVATGLTFWGSHNWAISTGTVTVNATANVIGDGDVDWTNVVPGDSFQVDGDSVSYVIDSVDIPAKTLVLTTNYTGTGGAGKNYAIWNDDTLRWIDATPDYEQFSLPKRLKGKCIQIHMREEGDTSELEIYSLNLRLLPREGAR